MAPVSKEAMIISAKIAELKASWAGLSEEDRRKKLFGLHLMLAASDELLLEAALRDIVPELETEASERKS